MGCRHYIAFLRLPNFSQGDNIGYVFRPETQALARGFSAISTGTYIIIVKDELVSNLQRVFAEANQTPMLLPGSSRIHMAIPGLL